MSANSDNQGESAKSPQQELEELLRQARPMASRPKVFASPKPLFSGKSLPGMRVGKSTLMALLLAGLAVVLVFGTGAFIVSSLGSNTGQVVFEINEPQAVLTIDGASQGVVSSGSTLRLKTGEHKLSFAKEGFLTTDQTIQVLRDESVSVLVNLLPIPLIERVVSGPTQYARLNKSGVEISYLDLQDNGFKTVTLSDKIAAELFRDTFTGIVDVAWSSASQMAVVQIAGTYSLPNMIDNRGVPGGYVVLGESPQQGAPKNNGIATWFFDDSRKLAASGWQPVLLSESIRQLAFAGNGEAIVYIYDTADGEYSLVRALPDGREWERLIVELPRFSEPKLTWGADDRYLLIEDQGKLWLVDLIDKTLADVFPDRLPGSQFAVSNEGDRVAYVANGEVRIYDFMTLETKAVPELSVTERTVFTWLDPNTLVLALANQTFIKADVDTGQQIVIPFVGTDGELSVTRMAYSRAGQVLMMEASDGLYVMKI